MTYTATYSPEDNKLRLSASQRLDKDLYNRVRAAGFIWAPKQEIFVAPMWTPERADLCEELAGQIDDEDTSLVERAEERAERFDGYRENRTSDAEQARAAVSRIADGIPLGQPILVGHHSERHARRDAEKIENGMRRAVKMWETASYWKSRAAGAIRHAKYKELPAVRARRIKGLEAEARKQERYIKDAQTALRIWAKVAAIADPEEQERTAIQFAGNTQCGNVSLPRKEGDKPDWDQRCSAYEGLSHHYPNLYAKRTVAEVLAAANEAYPRSIAHHQRWLDHYCNRLEYENAMLQEGGGLVADKFNFAIGGQVLRRGKWFVVSGLNRRDGQLLSVSVVGHWCGTIQVEEINDYKEPAEGDGEKVKAATKLAPLCNFPGEGFRYVEKANLKKTYSVWIHTFPATETHAAYRSYSTFKGGGGLDCHNRVGIYITDQKRKDPPTKDATPKTSLPVVAPTERGPSTYRAPEPTEYDAMRESLKAGVQVVSAPQLFPTPTALAQRMVDEAGISASDEVLEPSAGTGALLEPIRQTGAKYFAVEIDMRLAGALAQRFATPEDAAQGICRNVLQGDFLEQNGNLGKFDAVIMNPPFSNAQDIAHIEHALRFLKPGGRLVAICANGPRQQAKLKPLIEGMGGTWEPLPADTFKESGTGVNTVLLTATA